MRKGQHAAMTVKLESMVNWIVEYMLDNGYPPSKTEMGAALLVFYSSNLEDTLEKVTKAGGKIIKPTFSFPGGRRFHFVEPSGNEFAVWSDSPR